ncbi:MAG: magnesium transporter [Yaniella sp.]|uniref:magnesium transporter n=1 Tax=Yaniella sp. TaxID=2773929 RepID=UPI002649E3D4|nr:magnesium transporter [Yaniella sp.]MDN5704464.1 magnesium transporter [Yaniella sp.]MDN5730527.1 magnesium transporter [Yaniella sp.]MDN5742772.1 magnesium transporter [Yaniella sp.]MDN5814784.1 magnesium transporter [Yaniella sp.]MDN5817143.1 magnesium transporter [Yaniella sp.]
MSDLRSAEAVFAEQEEEVWDLLRAKEYATAAELLRDMRGATVERLLDRTPPSLMPVAFRLLDKDVAVEVFGNMEPSLQSDLIDGLADEHTQDLFSQLQSSTQARLVDEVPAEVAQRLLASLGEPQRNAAGKILGYPEDSVGRRMAAVPQELTPNMSVATALNIIRDVTVAEHEIDHLSVLPVGSTSHKVLGLVHLPKLVRAEPDELISDIMDPTETVHAHDDVEDAARTVVHDRVQALPVVDEADRLIGMLTMADAQQVLEEEESEDSFRSGGAEPLGQPYLSTSVMHLVKSRVTWLLVLGIGAVLTVQVLDYFEDTLAAMVVLTLFVPLLTGTGGNTGNQAATTVTRAIALSQVTTRDFLRVISREALVGVTLGLLLGTLGFIGASIFFDVELGLVIGATLVVICTLAASVGSIMPLIASKIGVDPAVFSNPFISTVVDALGLIVYFLIAKAILGI